MMNPTERVLRAIVSLSGNEDWEEIKRWIKDSLGQAFLECSTYRPEPTSYPFMSGRAYELKEIINTIEKAKEKLEMIHRKK
jgi:hypothetical protein